MERPALLRPGRLAREGMTSSIAVDPAMWDPLLMSTADPFLPIQGTAALPDTRPLQREDHDIDDESEVDILTGPPDESVSDDAVPPATETPFRTPTGVAVDPADDIPPGE